MRNAIQGFLAIAGLLLLFGGVGYMEQGGGCLLGTVEFLIGLGMWYLVPKLEPACQPIRHQPFSNPQDLCRRV